MKMENEFWFCDTSNGLEYTIGQFIDFIESHNDWHDSEKSSYALCHLKGPAKKFSEKNLKPEMDWKKIKKELHSHFRSHFSLRDKVELLRGLIQKPNESIKDFFNRCISCQYIICDDDVDSVVERDILLSFLLGMQTNVYEEVVCAKYPMNLQNCLKESEKLELVLNNSCQINLENIKIETNVKQEFGEIEDGNNERRVIQRVKVEYSDDENMYLDNFYDISDGNNEIHSNEIEAEISCKKEKKRKRKKYDCSDDEDEDPDFDINDINESPKKKKKKTPLKQLDYNSSDDELDDPDFVVDKDEKTICSLCGGSFNKFYIEKHMEWSHGIHKNDGRKKDGKSIVWGTVKNYNELTQETNTTKLRNCKHCDVKLRGDKVYRTHMNNFHPDKIWKCELCPPRRFSTSNGLMTLEQSQQVHKILYHGEKDDEDRIVCLICKENGIEKLLKGKTKTIDHIKDKHFDIRPYKCTHCQKDFLRQGLLDEHIENEHIEMAHLKTKIYKCNHCEETFDTKRKLNNHRNNVHHTKNPKNKKFVCDTCGHSTHIKECFRRHLETHNEKSIICDQCAQTFKSQHNLKLHKLNKHSEKLFKCNFPGCEDKTFARPTDVSGHIKRCHREKEYNFKCDHCPKRFISSQQRLKHVKAIHLGIKEFKCDQCDFECAYRNNFIEHKNSVHKGIMYRCDYPGCTKEMNRKGNLDVHKKTAHGISRPSERNSNVTVITGI